MAARTRAALRAKRARGERAGNTPLGFKVNGDGRTLYPDDHEQQIVILMQECRAAGYTLRAIADELNRKGFTTRTGQPFRHQNVASALQTIERYPSHRET